jgi:hypothetical protein
MVVRFLRSTISLRPPRSWHAFLQLVRSSATPASLCSRGNAWFGSVDCQKRLSFEPT